MNAKTIKSSILGLILILLLGLFSLSLTACDDDLDKAYITVENDSYSITIAEPGEEVSTIQFTVSVEELNSGSLYYSVRNDGIIKVSLVNVRGLEYLVTVQAISAGEATIVFFLGENSSVRKSVKINVVQPISAIWIDSNYEYYAKKGEVTMLNLGSDLHITPSTASISTIKYELYSNPANLNVTVSESGVLDATNWAGDGQITVRVYASDTVFALLKVNIVEAANSSDINVSYKFSHERLNTTIFRNDTYYLRQIELIKTGSGGIATPFIDYYNEASLYIEGRYAFANYTMQYKLEGNSASSTYANGDWVTLTQNTFNVQSIELGTTHLTIRVNKKGAENFFEYVTIELDIVTIDVPISISATDAQGTNDTTVQYDSTEKVYKVSVFNSYAEGSY